MSRCAICRKRSDTVPKEDQEARSAPFDDARFREGETSDARVPRAPHGKMRVMPTSAATSTTFAPLPSAERAADGVTARPVAAWLLICCALVFAMIVVG